MSETFYTEDHEWVVVEYDDVVTVGITDYAQEQLGDIVFVELPEIESELSQGDEACVVESVKAAGEVKAPVSGVVIEVNEDLNETPEIINDDPIGRGWFYKMKMSDSTELENLMSETSYQQLVASLS